MRRREFITALGGAAVAWPLAARAQQSTMPVIGVIGIGAPGYGDHYWASFRQGLNETGWVEGKNLVIEYRWARGRNDRLPVLAGELVARQVDAIFASGGTPGALAAKAATKTIPILFAVGGDPVAAGLVTSLNRPGGNLTGMTIIALDVAGKRLELLREMVPNTAVIGLIVNPTNPYTQPETKEVSDAARLLGLQLHIVGASEENEFDSAFATLVHQRAGAVLLSGDPFLLSRADQLVALTDRHRMPAIFGHREYVAAGGLMSYGGSIASMWRQVGIYAGRILSGGKPADLPIMQPTTFQLVINLKTAKALGLEVPPTLLARADEVIE